MYSMIDFLNNPICIPKNQNSDGIKILSGSVYMNHS